MVKCPELSSGETEGDDQSQRILVLKLVIPAVLHWVKLRRVQDIHGTKQVKVCQICLNKTDISAWSERDETQVCGFPKPVMALLTW